MMCFALILVPKPFIVSITKSILSFKVSGVNLLDVFSSDFSFSIRN